MVYKFKRKESAYCGIYTIHKQHPKNFRPATAVLQHCLDELEFGNL